MTSRIDIGPSGGPFVELDEQSGDFVLTIPNNLIDVSDSRITNVGTPTNDTDAATKCYADSLEQGLDVKDSVRATTDATNIDLASATDPNPIDGVTLSVGDRVLLKDQTTASENGIYDAVTATDPTTWVRSDDANNDDEVTDGLFVWVNEGTNFGDGGFILTTDDPITLGTTDLAFVRFSGAGQIVAGSNLTKDANTLAVASTVNITGEYQLGGNTLAQSVVDSGQVSLSSGSATVSTGITATDATFYPAIGVDDPGADVTGLAAQLDFDTSTSEYKLTVKETGSSQNPTVNYDIVRVR